MKIISSGWFKSIWKSNCWVCRKPPSKDGTLHKIPTAETKMFTRARILNDIFMYIYIYIISYIIIYLYMFLWVASRMCPSWMFLSVSFHVDHVKFCILEVFLALGMFGREFGSILPGVISSITNPNNNCTLLFALETTENSYICIAVPWVIESTWINLTRYVQIFGISEVHWKQPFFKWSNWMSRSWNTFLTTMRLSECFTIRSSGLSVFFKDFLYSILSEVLEVMFWMFFGYVLEEPFLEGNVRVRCSPKHLEVAGSLWISTQKTIEFAISKWEDGFLCVFFLIFF